MAIGAVNPYRARINGENKANRNRIAIATGAAIAGVATTLILAKKGKLNPVEGGNKIIEEIKKPLKKVTDNIFNFIAGSKTIAKATTEIGKLQKKISPTIEKASEMVEGVIADVETVAANVEGTIKGNAPKVKEKAGKFVNETADKIKTETPKVVDFAKELPEKAKTALGTLKDKAADLVDKIIKKNVNI